MGAYAPATHDKHFKMLKKSKQNFGTYMCVHALCKKDKEISREMPFFKHQILLFRA
jgi:hypothetical protein